MGLEPMQVSPVESKPPQRPLAAGIVIIVIVLGLLCVSGGGFFGYQYYTTGQTQTAVAQGNTATAQQNATDTQVAEVTGTAQSHATATGVVVATTTAQAQATATGIANVTATADSLMAAANVPFSWRVYEYDAFDHASSQWGTGHSDSKYIISDKMIDKGVYTWAIQSKSSVIDWGYPYMTSLTDFYVSVEARIASGDDNVGYGLVFRHPSQQDSFYEVTVKDRGSFALWRYDKSFWTQLRSGSSKEVIRGGKNTVAVRAIGDQLTLYINQQEVGSVQDSRIKSGFVGILVEAPYGGLKASVEFDNFVLLVP